MVELAGYTRKHAITLLNQVEPLSPWVARKRCGRPRAYRHCLPAVELAWEALDYCCAQRLHPQLVPLTECLARHGELQLTLEARAELRSISRATLARRLAERPIRKPKQVPSGPHPNRVARSLVPIDKYAWNEDQPGALEVDPVEHSDGRRGHHAYTLSVVDVVSGWSRRQAVMGKSQAAVFEALTSLLREWPTSVWAIHSDNGTEFLGAHLINYSHQHDIAYHHSRPYQKNDNAHVEQKNRQYVREIIGYERIDNQCGLNWLNAIYQHLDVYANLFLPSLRLIERTRQGDKVKKRYDTQDDSQRVWADQGYKGQFQAWVRDVLHLDLEVVYPWWRQLERYLPGVYAQLDQGFKVIARRWVERTFAWWTFQRRLNRDYELLPACTECFIYATVIRLMVRRLTC